jgi:hypothetical protein
MRIGESTNLNSRNTWLVITSIYPQREELLQTLDLGWSVVIVGDLKTPKNTWSSIKRDDFYYLSPESQAELFPEFSSLIGFGTYARKNIGYLFAISKGARAIWDTDDDTYIRKEAKPYLTNINSCQFSRVSGDDYFNPYVYFAPKSGLWPRGYPLRKISSHRRNLPESLEIVSSNQSFDFDILQTLVNIEPDLDAIYRMAISDEPLNFNFSNEILGLDKAVISPGNTQSTLWINPAKFVYLYIPRWVSFRFCDILKMYIAQSRSKLAYGGFWSEQYRNPHDYMVDFESEVQCCLNTERVVAHLANSDAVSLEAIYLELAELGVCSMAEVAAASLFESSVLDLLK